MEVKEGHLLISDISGYTEFLVSSELQHANRRETISFEKVLVCESIESPAPSLLAWDYVTDEEQKRIYYDMISVKRTDNAPWVGEGLRYHYTHAMGDVGLVITDWHPPPHFVSDEIILVVPVQFIMRILPVATAPATRSCATHPTKAIRPSRNLSSAKWPRTPCAGWRRSWRSPALRGATCAPRRCAYSVRDRPAYLTGRPRSRVQHYGRR